MFNQRQFFFTLAEVGHHSEVLNKILYAWFNNSHDDVTMTDDGQLSYMKISMSQFGKPFLIGLLFKAGHLNDIMRSGIKFKTDALAEVPLPIPGDNPRLINQTWPICTAMHLKSNSDIRMVEQLNSADTDLCSIFTPYKRLDEKIILYAHDRNKVYELVEEVDNVEQTIYNIKQHEVLVNRKETSILHDIVYDTHHTLDDLYQIFGQGPVTDIGRLRAWLHTAHNAYKQFYEGK